MNNKLDSLAETVNFEPSLSFVVYHNKQNISYPKHWHSAVEIVMPIRNSYSVTVNDEAYKLRQYDIFIIPSGDLHELSAVTELGERIILQFDLSVFKATEEYINSAYIFLKPILITPETNTELHVELKTILLEILDEYEKKDNCYEAGIIIKILDFAFRMAKKQNHEITQDPEYFIRKREHITAFNKCIDYIGQHYKENLTLDHISSIAGFSKYYFWRWFQQYSSMTFKAYLDQIRIKAAESLLMDLNVPITDVALESGFQSIATFNRVFKNMNKCTPTEYREYSRISGRIESSQGNAPEFLENTVSEPAADDNSAETAATMPPEPCAVFPELCISEPLADMPEPDIIRVGETFYMVCPTSGFEPGCPIMRSYDLLNFEIVCYVYDILSADRAPDITSCGIRHNDGKFYVYFTSPSIGKTFFFVTGDIEKNEWQRYEFDFACQSLSLLFDGGKAYIIYGENSLCTAQLDTADGVSIKENSQKTIIKKISSAYGIKAYKTGGYFYVFYVNRIKKNMVCCRSRRIDGEYEQKIFPENELLGGEPVSLVSSAANAWYACASLRRDNIGRGLKYFPVAWENGFPIVMFSQKPLFPRAKKTGGFIRSDEFYQGAEPSFTVNNREIYKELASRAGYNNDIQRLSVEVLENNSFENGLNSWTSYNSANISIKNNDRGRDKYMLYVSGRRSASSGPMQVVTGKVAAGEKFRVAALIKYTAGPLRHTFNISVINGSAGDKVQVMASAEIDRGEWCLIEGTYTVPENTDTSKTCVLIESGANGNSAKNISKDNLMDFFVGSVSMIKRLSLSSRSVLEGEYDCNGSNLGPQWQWRHNPDNNNWSLTERSSYLRITAGNICTSLSDAANTLTQRTFGPVCSGITALETQGMNSGDTAGLAALHKNYAYIAVKMHNNQKFITTVIENGNGEETIFEISCDERRVYFRLDIDFSARGRMFFYYGFDCVKWLAAGDAALRNDVSGCRFGLFNFAREFCGGYCDFDFFRVDNSLVANAKKPATLTAGIVAPAEIRGVPNTEFEAVVEADTPKNLFGADKHGDISVSLSVPDVFDVIDISFNAENVSGNTSYSYENNRLLMSAANTLYINKNSNTFAAIRLRVKSHVPLDTTACIKLDYFYIKGCNAAYKLNETECVIKLNSEKLGSPAKLPGASNPLIDHKYGADPFALAYGGRVYIYLTSDAPEYDENGKILTNTYSKITSITVISSPDLVNWTDHGEIPVAGSTGIAKWADHSWAPSVACKNINGKDRFFLYFANDASNIGVLTASSPIGPWSDPLGTSLVNRSIKGVENVTWCFDPAVLVDDDGSAYLYFGGGLPSESEHDVLHPNTARVIKLGDDMISVCGEAMLIDAPALFEDSGIHKYNGKYYYSYCSNFAGTHPEGYPPHGEIAYMVSDNPMSGFKYVGPILKNPEHFFGVGGNNHHAIFEFCGKWYITYHAQTLAKAIGDVKGYRSPHINEIQFYNGGNIKEVAADMKGVAPVAAFNPYAKTDAVTYAWSSGVTPAMAQDKLILPEIRDGDWIAIAAADFGKKGAAVFSANIKPLDGGVIELHLDSHDGEIIGILRANAMEKSWTVKSCEVKKVTGIHDVFIVFKGGDGNLFSLDYWKFSE